MIQEIYNIVENPTFLIQGYRDIDGYIFTSVRHPANVFDGILIRNPCFAKRFGDNLPCSLHSLSEHIDFINKHKIEKATVIADDISFLEQCPTLEHLNIIPSVTAGDNFDYSPLYNLNSVLSLYCSTKYGKFDENSAVVDYSKICGLEHLEISAENNINFAHIPSLKSLSVFDSKNTEIREYFDSEQLDTLRLTKCRIRSLDGLEISRKMQCVYLSYNRNLSDINGLAKVKNTLKALHIENCAGIKDFSVLSQLENLEYLFITGSNKIQSLDFVTKLPKLKTLIFDMQITDGDLYPCLKLSYVHCGRIYRHYNLKAKDLPKGEYCRGNENIDPWRRI